MIPVSWNVPSCHMSKPSGVTLVVCEELHLRVHVCMLCIISVRVCVRYWGMRSKKSCRLTHSSSLSPTLSASLFIHLLQLSGWFYHPVSCREITSDKLGWLNRLGKLADPANHRAPLPPGHYLLNTTLDGCRAWSAKITVLTDKGQRNNLN